MNKQLLIYFIDEDDDDEDDDGGGDGGDGGDGGSDVDDHHGVDILPILGCYRSESKLRKQSSHVAIYQSKNRTVCQNLNCILTTSNT